MGGRLFLGNTLISPVIVGNNGGAFNVDVNDLLGTVNEQGVLVKDTKDINFVFDGVKSIEYSLHSRFYNDKAVKSVSFPDLEVASNLYRAFRDSNVSSISFPKLTTISDGCMETFRGCPITEVNLPMLKTISGSDDACCGTFADCPIISINLPELETISGSSACASMFALTQIETVSFPKLKSAIGHQMMAGMFSRCSKLKKAYFPALEIIDAVDESMNFAFLECPLLEEVDLHSLKKASNGGMSGFFNECPNLKTVDLSSLEEIGSSGLGQCFDGTSIETFTFPELVKINSFGSLYGTFGNCHLLQSLYFPKLTTIESTTQYTDCFENMLDGCENVVVHFNAEIEDIIGEWADVLAGFGGTNTTVLYDLNACIVVMNVSGSANYEIYVNGKEKTSPFPTGSSNKQYYIYDLTNNCFYFGELTGLVPNQTKTINIDLTQGLNKITLSTGVSNLSVSVSYDGKVLNLTDEGNGNYSFYSNGSDKEISYSVGEGTDTRAETGTITLTGAAQTISITPTPKGWETYTRPNIWVDGTMGVNDFAVTSSGCYSTALNRQAFCAVNGNTTTTYYWYSTNITNPIYYFYNKNQLKVAALSFKWTTASYRATQVVVAGSNDYENWTNIGTYALGNATTATATINSNTPYNYYRLTFTKGGTYIRLIDLGITGTEYR